MKPVILIIMILICMFPAACPAAAQDSLNIRNSAETRPAENYPQIVLYSVSWCPHCRSTKEYFTRNGIPFINRDVEEDADALEVLTGKYKRNGVPVIVIGTGTREVVLEGFSPELFQESLKKFRQ